MTITHKRTDEKISVPCGKCPKCLARRISGWSFRLMQEERYSDSAHFITLTYDTKYVPITRAGFMELRKRDVQLFFKRLRKAHANCNRNDANKGNKSGVIYRPIKYYVAGEYGGKTNRPHYHAIIFNVQLELIQPAWNLGSIHYGKVSGASVGYTLKYMSKPKRIPMHRNDDRQPEFSLMSKGLGLDYISKEIIAWHNADHLNRMYIQYDGNKKAAMPRYYKNRIYTEDIRKEIAGYQKGQIEAKTLDHVSKYIDTKHYHHNRKEAVKASFAAMHKKALEGRDKVL